jgi:AAA+ superfamily predicted ATPase
MNFCSFIGIVNELKRVDKNTVIAKIAVESKPNILDRIIKLRVPDDILFKN